MKIMPLHPVETRSPTQRTRDDRSLSVARRQVGIPPLRKKRHGSIYPDFLVKILPHIDAKPRQCAVNTFTAEIFGQRHVHGRIYNKKFIHIRAYHHIILGKQFFSPLRKETDAPLVRLCHKPLHTFAYSGMDIAAALRHHLILSVKKNIKIVFAQLSSII